MATDYDSQPIPPAHKSNSRTDMPQTRGNWAGTVAMSGSTRLKERERTSFLEMAFGEFLPGFDIPESSQDDFPQVETIDFYYG
jgi:hypothetical protein